MSEPPYEGIPTPLPRCNLTDNVCRFDICPKKRRKVDANKKGWLQLKREEIQKLRSEQPKILVRDVDELHCPECKSGLETAIYRCTPPYVDLMYCLNRDCSLEFWVVDCTVKQEKQKLQTLLEKKLLENLKYVFEIDDIPNNHGNALDLLAEKLHDKIVKNQARNGQSWAKLLQPVIWKWWKEQTSSLVDVLSQIKAEGRIAYSQEERQTLLEVLTFLQEQQEENGVARKQIADITLLEKGLTENLQKLIDILALPNMGDEGRKAKLVAIKAWQINFRRGWANMRKAVSPIGFARQ